MVPIASTINYGHFPVLEIVIWLSKNIVMKVSQNSFCLIYNKKLGGREVVFQASYFLKVIPVILKIYSSKLRPSHVDFQQNSNKNLRPLILLAYFPIFLCLMRPFKYSYFIPSLIYLSVQLHKRRESGFDFWREGFI